MRALEVKNIIKQFPGVLANDKINLSVDKGKIFAIVGENGAGKSTLMKIIYGLYTPTSGEIYVFGKKTDIKNPHDAINLKIGMVHQEFMLIPRFTVTQNIVLGIDYWFFGYCFRVLFLYNLMIFLFFQVTLFFEPSYCFC